MFDVDHFLFPHLPCLQIRAGADKLLFPAVSAWATSDIQHMFFLIFLVLFACDTTLYQGAALCVQFAPAESASAIDTA